MAEQILRGDIFLADLSTGVGSEQQGRRPVLILQNNMGNRFAPTVIIAPITARMEKTDLPTHVLIREEVSGLERDSFVLLEQLRAIDKSRLLRKIGSLNKVNLMETERATLISLGLLKEEEI
ncbi:type II toxin-antitoxin system PemK/MazF family toxin [Guggenheimella bovis]